MTDLNIYSIVFTFIACSDNNGHLGWTSPLSIGGGYQGLGGLSPTPKYLGKHWAEHVRRSRERMPLEFRVGNTNAKCNTRLCLASRA
jgi:hypothetical protein